jgi:hypothetical protein
MFWIIRYIGLSLAGGSSDRAGTCWTIPDSQYNPDIWQVRPASNGDPRATAGRSWEAIVASLVVLVIIVTVIGVCLGVFLTLSLAIAREDRKRYTLRFDAPNSTGRAARTLVGLNGSRWD